MNREPRPTCIKHFSDISEGDCSYYPGSDERHGVGSPFGRTLGLKRIGIHHEILMPGRRTSWPHAEADEEGGLPDSLRARLLRD